MTPLPPNNNLPEVQNYDVGWSEVNGAFGAPPVPIDNQKFQQEQLLSLDEQQYLSQFLNSLVSDAGSANARSFGSHADVFPEPNSVHKEAPLGNKTWNSIQQPNEAIFNQTAMYSNMSVGGAASRKKIVGASIALPPPPPPPIPLGYAQPGMVPDQMKHHTPHSPYDIGRRHSMPMVFRNGLPVSPETSSTLSSQSPDISISSHRSSPQTGSVKPIMRRTSGDNIAAAESGAKRHAVKNGFAMLASLVPGLQSSKTSKPKENEAKTTLNKAPLATASPSKSIILTKVVEYLLLLQRQNLEYVNELHFLLQAYADVAKELPADGTLAETLYQLSAQSALLDACSDTVHFLNDSFTTTVPHNSFFESYPYIINPFVQHLDYDTYFRETTPAQALSHPGLIESCHLTHSKKFEKL